MNKFLILLFAISISHLSAQIKDSSIIIIPSSYSLSMETPKIVLTGETITFNADSIYLVNKTRFRFYEELRNKLVTLDFDCEPAIELYKRSLTQNSLLVQQLLANSNKTNQLNLNFATDSQILLDKNSKAVDLSLNNLNIANENLELAKTELEKIKRNNFFGNVLYTLAGIGIGIIVGVSIN